jgi:GNAT superfamily N-acetyltransferase
VKRVVPTAGDFYVPELASDGRTGWVPGTPDTHRRLFLERAATLEPDLLASLRRVTADDARALSSWAKRWHLTDPWCLALARDTARWYAAQPDAQGWEFEGKAIFAGMFPFAIEPLELRSVYYDPTWQRRGIFKRHVLEQVARDVDNHCDRIEAAALDAGLKRVSRKREVEHFDWLVRYQIKGDPYASIAQNASYKFKGGRKAIVDLAEHLALTLRSST